MTEVSKDIQRSYKIPCMFEFEVRDSEFLRCEIQNKTHHL